MSEELQQRRLEMLQATDEYKLFAKFADGVQTPEDKALLINAMLKNWCFVQLGTKANELGISKTFFDLWFPRNPPEDDDDDG